MAKTTKATRATPAATPVEIVVPAPTAAPMFGGPNSGNLGWTNMPAPKPLTGGAAASFTLDPKRK